MPTIWIVLVMTAWEGERSDEVRDTARERERQREREREREREIVT